MDYSFQIAWVQSPPPPLPPSPTDIPSPIFSEGEGVAVHRLSETDNPCSNCPSKLMDKVSRMVHSKLNYSIFKLRRSNYLTPITKWITHPLMNGQSQTDNTFLALVSLKTANYSARLMRFGSPGPSEFFSQIRHRNALTEIDRDCVGRRRTGTRHGNVYRSDREKQGIVVHRNVFYKR